MREVGLVPTWVWSQLPRGAPPLCGTHVVLSETVPTQIFSAQTLDVEMTSPDHLMKFRFCFSSPSQSVLSPGEERGCGKGSWPETKRSACNPSFLSLLGEAPRIWGKWSDDEPVPSALQARAPRLSALGPVTPVFDTHSHREQGFPGDSGSEESASHAGDPG